MSLIGKQLINGVKHEVLKVDIDHDGKPDVLEAIDAVEKGIHSLESVLSRFNAMDYKRALNFLNQVAGQRISPAEIESASADLAAAGAGLQYLEKLLQAAEKQLEAK